MPNPTTAAEDVSQIVLLYCEHCTSRGAAALSTTVKSDSFSARMEMLPCSSKVEASYVLKILEKGADGVEVVGCPVGACRFLEGTIRAEKRIEFAKKHLATIGMGAERLGMTRGADFTKDQLVAIAQKRAQVVAPLGKNPMKGGNTL